jgi:hypothetical protein
MLYGQLVLELNATTEREVRLEKSHLPIACTYSSLNQVRVGSLGLLSPWSYDVEPS